MNERASLPGESHGQRSLASYSPRGRKELDATEQLTLHSVILLMNENLVSLYPSQQVNIVKVLNFNNLLGLLLYSFFFLIFYLFYCYKFKIIFKNVKNCSEKIQFSVLFK